MTIDELAKELGEIETERFHEEEYLRPDHVPEEVWKIMNGTERENALKNEVP